MTINVKKRDGNLEPLNLEKIHKVLGWACEDITGVSVSEIAMKSQLKFYDGIKTSQIHETLIKTAADLISEDTPNYQYVAGNLLNYDIRKTAWGGKEAPNLYEYVCNMVAHGFYTDELLSFYTKDDFEKMDGFIDHDRDFNMTYIGLNEYATKYSVRDRTLSDLVPLETPQFTYMLVAALCCLDTRKIKDIKSMYNDFSIWNISLPTPIMAGLRTPVKQFSSCVLISSGDDIESITAASTAVVKYASKKAGIGIDASRIRAEGDPVGKGNGTKHTGVIPFLRMFEGALKSSAQGAVRGASATCYLPLWHLEALDLLVLKNNKGTPDSRVRKLDYGFQINNYLYNRLIAKKPITLFSTSHRETPGLYEAFFQDGDKFAELYEKYEADPTIRKKIVNSTELFASLITERKETGRIYIFNVDNVNTNSPFKETITTSNLCSEIALPTVPMGSYETLTLNAVPLTELKDTLLNLNEDIYLVNYKLVKTTDDSVDIEVTYDKSLVALCTLSAINIGNVKNFDDLENVCKNAVKALDNLLDYQDYMVPAAKRHTLLYRPLGIGITNLAYYLAKNGVKYADHAALELMHDTMEAISFYCIKASIELAKERGPCLGYENTTWSDGILPIDRYNKNVDSIIAPQLKLDWEWLRKQLKMYGIRNSTLIAMMPAESSSRIFNSTNGVEPVRSLITTKSNKEHITKQVVPEYGRLKNKYDLLWDMKNMDGIIKMMAVIQKFTCQSISTNTSYNPEHFNDGKIPMSVMIGDILKANFYGIKTLYYNNIRDGAEDTKVEDAVEQQIVPNVQDVVDEAVDEVCDACSI